MVISRSGSAPRQAERYALDCDFAVKRIDGSLCCLPGTVCHKCALLIRDGGEAGNLAIAIKVVPNVFLGYVRKNTTDVKSGDGFICRRGGRVSFVFDLTEHFPRYWIIYTIKSVLDVLLRELRIIVRHFMSVRAKIASCATTL